ncbi:shieldin complex subunit 2 [Discoglossus pictus]
MMSNQMIHVFVGAPVIPSPSNESKEGTLMGSQDLWQERRVVYHGQDIYVNNNCKIFEDMERPEDTVSLLGCTEKISINTCPKDGKSALEYETCETDKHPGVECTRDISDLVSSTQHCQINPISENLCGSLHKSLSQYLDDSFPKKTEKSLDVRRPNDTLEISTNTEFLSVLMSSQAAVLDRGKMCERDVNFEPKDKENDLREVKLATIAPHPYQDNSVAIQEYSASSLELFTQSSIDAQSSQILCFEKSIQCQEDQQNLVELSGNYVEDRTKVTPIDGFKVATFKRTRNREEVGTSHLLCEKQQQPKKAKQSSSPVKVDSKGCQMRKCMLVKPMKELVLLKQCVEKKREYSILVTVLHPCHVKEIQVKSGPNAGSSVPLSTIVVLDQSEIERKVVLWREAAFWTLAVFPGDIIMLTNLTVCEDKWNAETLLQSTGRSRLLNIGSCSSLCLQDVSNMKDGAALNEFLEYLCTKHGYLRELPSRQPQQLDHIPCVRLNELQPDTLVHSIVKVGAISTLTECVYQFKGHKQKKIILTVEEIKGHPCTMVLWGSCITWCDQIQRRREHIWEFRHLFVRRNSVTGDMELHTTPWSSCECLFHDDKRAVEFKKIYNKNEGSLLQQMDIQTLLEEKCSGEIQLKASISELEFSMPGSQNILIDQDTVLSDILVSIPTIIYSGCGNCRVELKTDENHVFEQCFSCLPFNQVKKFYRPVRMTAVSGDYGIRVNVPSDILEKIFLNISPESVDKAVVSCSEVTYKLVVADLVHSLVAGTGESHLLKIRSHFVLDENSVPMEQEFYLLDFEIIL